MFLLGVCGIYWCGGVDGVQKKIGRVKIIERLRRLDKKRSECAICCCDFEVGVKVARTQCGHLFHYDCLAEWAATGNNTCPLCREPIDIDLGDGIASAATIEVAAAVASIEAEATKRTAREAEGPPLLVLQEMEMQEQEKGMLVDKCWLCSDDHLNSRRPSHYRPRPLAGAAQPQCKWVA
eukprot:g3790.t1